MRAVNLGICPLKIGGKQGYRLRVVSLSLSPSCVTRKETARKNARLTKRKDRLLVVYGFYRHGRLSLKIITFLVVRTDTFATNRNMSKFQQNG